MLNRGNFNAGLTEGIKVLWNLHSSLGVQNKKKKSRKRCVCMHVHVQLFCDPMDCSLPGSSVYGISQARLLESFSLSGKFVISSVLSRCSKNLKWRTCQCYSSMLQLSLICKQRKIHPWGVRVGQPKDIREEKPKAQFWLLFLYDFFVSPWACPM